LAFLRSFVCLIFFEATQQNGLFASHCAFFFFLGVVVLSVLSLVVVDFFLEILLVVFLSFNCINHNISIHTTTDDDHSGCQYIIVKWICQSTLRCSFVFGRLTLMDAMRVMRFVPWKMA
jgi:hypothetical protein